MESHPLDIYDPISYYKFDIEIRGFGLENNDYFPIIATWHLDKHSQLLTKEGSADSFCHPEYHLTFGGHRMKNSEHKLGNLLLFPSPRIAHPPLDIILGIDFILQNFIHKDQRLAIYKSTQFLRILQNARARIWRTYALSFASIWENSLKISDSNIRPNKILSLFDI